jgi:hypothetical protein
MSDKIPIERVEGHNEVTVWLWPNSPEPVTVRFDKSEWREIEKNARKRADGDVERFLTDVILDDFEA